MTTEATLNSGGWGLRAECDGLLIGVIIAAPYAVAALTQWLPTLFVLFFLLIGLGAVIKKVVRLSHTAVRPPDRSEAPYVIVRDFGLFRAPSRPVGGLRPGRRGS